MAGSARLRKTGRDVIGIGGLLEVGKVAALAGGGRAGEAAVDMTLCAGNVDVRAGERKRSHCVVVKLGAEPRGGAMAARTILRKAGRGVIGIFRRGIVLGMATETVGRSALVMPARVAGEAVQARVSAGEGEAGGARVIKVRARPTVHGVAGLALRGQVGRFVVGHRRALKGGAMARKTLCGKALELPGGRALVAREAILQGMGAQQRKAVLVLLHGLQRDFPAFYRVALLALRAELSAVNIGMAVRALRAHVGENQARVTQAALHGFMHAAQRIARLVMVEFRKIANRLPTGEGVTILASLVQRAVRTARGAALWRRLGYALLRLREAGQRRTNEKRRENLFAVGQWEHGLHRRAGVKE